MRIAYAIEIGTKLTLHPTGPQTSQIINYNLFITLVKFASIVKLKLQVIWKKKKTVTRNYHVTNIPENA